MQEVNTSSLAHSTAELLFSRFCFLCLGRPGEREDPRDEDGMRACSSTHKSHSPKRQVQNKKDEKEGCGDHTGGAGTLVVAHGEQANCARTQAHTDKRTNSTKSTHTHAQTCQQTRSQHATDLEKKRRLSAGRKEGRGEGAGKLARTCTLAEPGGRA